MYQIPGYSMLSATVTTLVLSIIFLILSYQSNKNYMRFWGFSWLLYSGMFLLDFLNLQIEIPPMHYILLRQVMALVGSYAFFIGTHHFFQIKLHRFLFIATLSSMLLIFTYLISDTFYYLCIIPNIIYCSGLLIYCGCMFISYSWTQNLPEKILASFFIILWGMFINHFGFSLQNTNMGIFTYFISIFTVNMLIFFLIIIYFKKARFLDTKQSARYRLLVENSADSMFLYDYKKGGFEYASPDIAHLIGVTNKQLYQLPDRFFDHINIAKKDRKILNLFKSPIASPGEGLLCLYEDGRLIRWSEIHYLPIKDATGSVTAVEGILRDVTESKRMEEDLQEMELAKKELLENISHEIKTPVTLIQGYTESLLDQIVPVESTDLYLNMIKSKAMMLNTLVDDLAQVSKFTSQSLEYQFYEKQAVDIFQEFLQQYHFQITQSGRTAKTNSTIRLDAIVIIDPLRIQQVISNLISNAIRHTPPGKQIIISCITLINDNLHRNMPENDDYTIPEGELIFKVRDEGDGIPEKYLPHIFERSFSEGRHIDEHAANSTSHAGLGLFISREIIKQHSGTIWAQNIPTGGVEVVFSIPFYT